MAWCCRSSISGRRRARRFRRYRDDRPVANSRGIGRLAQHSLLLQRWAIDLTQIGNELGVRYAISVEQATLGLRINARLFDAQNGTHLWAERFDRNHGDLFPTQDEIVFYLARMS